jgi:hypothetical protein
VVTDQPFRPVQVSEIELSEPLARAAATIAPPLEDGFDVRVLVRLHGAPLGVVPVGAGAPVTAGDIGDRVDLQLRDAIAAHLREDGVAAPDRVPLEGLEGQRRPCLEGLSLGPDTPMVTVVVAAGHAQERLVPCVDSILANDHPNFEVLVVGVSADDKWCRSVVDGRAAGPPVRYLVDASGATSGARNTGLAFSRGELVAFTDGDVVVDRGWVSTMAASLLESSDVACVTGPIVTSRLETPADVWLAEATEASGAFRPQDFRVAAGSGAAWAAAALSRVVPWGANLGVHKERLEDLWRFDAAMGSMTPVGGGEVLDRVLTTLLEGRTILYRPRALAWRPAATADDRRDEVRARALATSAVLTKQLLSGQGHRREMARVLGQQWLAGRSPVATEQWRPPLDAHCRQAVARRERLGVALGPVSYFRSRVRNAWASA